MSRRDRKRRGGKRRLSGRMRPLVALLALVIAPVAVYAGVVSGLFSFVNGTLTNADALNDNFTIVNAAVDDNEARIGVLETLNGQSCPPPQFLTGIGPDGQILCGLYPYPARIVITSAPIPAGVNGQVTFTPVCPGGTTIIAVGYRAQNGSGGQCSGQSFVQGAQQEGVGFLAEIRAGENRGECLGRAFLNVPALTNCECFAVCSP